MVNSEWLMDEGVKQKLVSRHDEMTVHSILPKDEFSTRGATLLPPLIELSSTERERFVFNCLSVSPVVCRVNQLMGISYGLFKVLSSCLLLFGRKSFDET